MKGWRDPIPETREINRRLTEIARERLMLRDLLRLAYRRDQWRELDEQRRRERAAKQDPDP